MMDFVLEAWVSGIIETRKVQWMLGRGEPWKPGEKLKLLFAGYNGTRNTGSDVRVEEMLRQVRRILGPDNVDLTMMTFNFDRSRGYFEGTSQVRLPDIFPPFLAREVPKHHGVVACEGSMFKFEICQRPGHDDDRLARHRCGREQTLDRLWRRGGQHGSANLKDVRTFLSRILSSLRATRNRARSCANSAFPPNSAPTRHGPSSLLAPSMDKRRCAIWAGMAKCLCWPSVPSIRLNGR